MPKKEGYVDKDVDLFNCTQFYSSKFGRTTEVKQTNGQSSLVHVYPLLVYHFSLSLTLHNRPQGFSVIHCNINQPSPQYGHTFGFESLVEIFRREVCLFKPFHLKTTHANVVNRVKN